MQFDGVEPEHCSEECPTEGALTVSGAGVACETHCPEKLTGYAHVERMRHASLLALVVGALATFRDPHSL